MPEAFKTFEGSNFFRQRIVLSCLSGQSLKITNIRSNEKDPGIKDFEVSFIRLIDRISNGSKIIVNETGTEVKFRPGILNGGKIEHNCAPSRSIGYFLEFVMLLAPFCKHPLNLTLRGVTNNNIDPSVDMINYSMIPVLKKFLVIDEGLSLKTDRRGMPPTGGGVVQFRCPVKRSMKAFQWEDMGKVQKIRGVVYACRVAPTVSNRIMEESKSVLKNFTRDIYFTCDNSKTSSPGYGLCLVAKTNKGSCLTAELIKSKEEDVSELDVPEDLGRKAAYSLLEEIYKGGCVDSISQSLVLGFMVLSPKDVSKIVLGPLTPYTMNFLKLLKDFFGVTFKIDAYKEKNLSVDDEHDFQLGAQKLLLTCLGVGYSNVSKPQI